MWCQTRHCVFIQSFTLQSVQSMLVPCFVISFVLHSSLYLQLVESVWYYQFSPPLLLLSIFVSQVTFATSRKKILETLISHFTQTPKTNKQLSTMSSFACTWGYDDFRQSWPACWVKLIWEYQRSVGGVNIREEKEEAFVIWVLWVCLSSSVTSDRQCVNTVLSYLCLCMEKRRRQPFEEKFCFTSACFFSLSWNRISYTDKQTPTHHSYYGCLISVAQDSVLSMWPKKHMGWCVFISI